MPAADIDVARRTDLTEGRLRVLTAIQFEQLPLDLAFRIVKGNGPRKMAYFTDPNCPYCKGTGMTTSTIAAKELAPTGKLRTAINFGNPVLAQKDSATGEARGVSVDIARELARRLGVALDLVTFDAAGKVFDALKTGAWDVAFLAIDPKRAIEIDFTAPYVIIEGSYMVRTDSPLRTIEAVDQPGVRVAVGNGSAYELHLSRTIRHAEILRAPTGNEAIEMFLRDHLEVVAGVKSPLRRFAASRSDLRVIDGRFMVIEQAMGTPKGRPAAARYLRGMVEDLKASGFVAASLERSGQHDAVIPPAASV